jgi:outer membrane protein TolC
VTDPAGKEALVKIALKWLPPVVWTFGLGCAHAPPPSMPAPPPFARPSTATPLTPSAVTPVKAEFDETLPVDLPTVLRLVNERSPSVGIARARIAEAQARLEKAELQWIPTLTVGAAYNHFDGNTQNQRGEVFSTSRGNLFAGGGVALTVDTAAALYGPLMERQRKAGAEYRYQASVIGSELDAALAYFDLVQVHAQIAINADVLEKANAMLTAATNSQTAKLDRTAGDINRARTEVLLRKQERVDLDGRAGVASARLARLLLLPPTVRLTPADHVAVPVTLIDGDTPIRELIDISVANHPNLAAHRAAIAAAWERVSLARKTPLLPKVTVADQVGGFGGGFNDDLTDFRARNTLGVQVYWELRNFGLGNRADVAEQRAAVDEHHYQLLDAEARLVAEIVEAAQMAKAKAEAIAIAAEAVKEATELYRIAKEGTLNLVDSKNLFDALRPLIAIQTLNQARTNSLNAILDYNRAQYRLFTALGHAPQQSQQTPAP